MDDVSFKPNWFVFGVKVNSENNEDKYRNDNDTLDTNNDSSHYLFHKISPFELFSYCLRVGLCGQGIHYRHLAGLLIDFYCPVSKNKSDTSAGHTVYKGYEPL
jgi:hypothetical protein